MARLEASITAVAVLAGIASGSPIKTYFGAPSLDRWMYPFNGTPGTELASPTLGAVGFTGFDDRDSQFILGFDTADQVPAGLGASAYRVTSARIRITVAGGDFKYDPSHDALETYFALDNPQHVDDSDDGRPVELFPVGYRNGESLETFNEYSEFGGEPINPPAEGARNVFAAALDSDGNATDASRNVRLGFEVFPLAQGVAAGVTPGEAVAVDTEFTFDVNLCDPGTRAYFAAALDAGKLNLSVSSLHDTVGGPGGPQSYPVWYTKENPLAQLPFDRTAKLQLSVVVDNDPDLNGDGVRDIFDFLTFQNSFVAQDPLADFDADCQYDLFDFLAYVNAFNK